MFTWSGTRFGPSTKRFATVEISFSVCVAFVSWILFLFHRSSIQWLRDTRLFRKMKWFPSSFLKPRRKWKNVRCILRFVWLIKALILVHSWGNRKGERRRKKKDTSTLLSVQVLFCTLHMRWETKRATCKTWCKLTFWFVKGMLHDTIRNHDFKRKRALQCWNNVVTIPNNIVTMLQRCVALTIVVANRLMYCTGRIFDRFKIRAFRCSVYTEPI